MSEQREPGTLPELIDTTPNLVDHLCHRLRGGQLVDRRQLLLPADRREHCFAPYELGYGHLPSSTTTSSGVQRRTCARSGSPSGSAARHA